VQNLISLFLIKYVSQSELAHPLPQNLLKNKNPTNQFPLAVGLNSDSSFAARSTSSHAKGDWRNKYNNKGQPASLA
jgi:hypothetical protein